MLSISNAESAGGSRAKQPEVETRILAAAESCVVDFGITRVTLAEIARRARLSRPTVYRRWPDTQSIIAALLTARITAVLHDEPAAGTHRRALVGRLVKVGSRLRRDELIMAVLHTAPELAMVYIVERLGTSQQILIDALAGQLKAAQADGSVRAGDPQHLAAMVLLILQSAIQSAGIVAPIMTADALDTELAHSLNGYLS